LDDRRKFDRVILNVLIGYKKEVEAALKNISESGICISTAVPLERGKFIRLVITLPDGLEMNLKGKVAWSLLTDESYYENGIDFLPVSTYYRDLLARFLN
jgi:hypothetical protein